MKTLKKIPHFKNENEEIDFWATHDGSDYIDFSKASKFSLPGPRPATKYIYQATRTPFAKNQNDREQKGCSLSVVDQVVPGRKGQRRNIALITRRRKFTLHPRTPTQHRHIRDVRVDGQCTLCDYKNRFHCE